MLSRKAHHTNLDISNRNITKPIPKYKMPEESMPARVAYEIIHDELKLDGNPLLNLATFVTTEMESEATQLMMENINKNYVDQDEYPQTTEIQNRCINILADLYNAPKNGNHVGTATIGSSEAIHLAGLALKWRWRERRKKQKKSFNKPNIVMGEDVQVCWKKFARYFEVEPRYVPLTNNRLVIGVKEAIELIDENTIALVGILGSTMSGEFEPIEKLHKELVKLNKKTGWNVPIHIDAASGGFIAPFAYPKLKWDFRLPLVKSINVSGHKYGLVYPGLGWVIWRDKEELPEDLIFHVNYLGNDEATFNLNFSKCANTIIGQYYNFLRLGKNGYRQIVNSLLNIASYITDAVTKIGYFDIISTASSLPLICFKLKESSKFSVFDLSNKLRERGWIIPAYTMPPNAEEIAVLRIVIREGFNRNLADILMADLQKAVEYLDKESQRPHSSTKILRKSKSHAKVC